MEAAKLIRKLGVLTNILFITGLGCLFAYSAATKFANQNEFQSSLTNSPLIPEGWGSYVGWGVPLVCLLSVIGLGLAFIQPRYMRWALLHYFYWMLTFTAYIIVILTIAPYKPCSCIGLIESLTWEEHLLANCIIITVNALLILWPFRYNKKNLKILAAACEAPSQPLKNGKYLKRKEV